MDKLSNLYSRLVSLIEHQNNTIDNLRSSIRPAQNFNKPQPIIFPTSPDFGSNFSSNFASVHCLSCNSYGHDSNNCPSSKNLYCARCGLCTHNTNNCPRRNFF